MSFHYPLPETGPQSPLSGLSDETRAALTHVAMGPSTEEQLLNPNGQPLPEQLDADFQEVIEASRKRSDTLFTITGMSSLHVPEIGVPELNVDWHRLQAGYDVLKAWGLEPELVISPEGQPLSFWEALYGGLRQWQDAHQPDAIHRLLNQDDGDGLFVNDEVKAHWNELTPSQPRWSVSVVPGTTKSPVLGVAYNGTNAEQVMPTELTNILQILPLVINDDHMPKHPSPENYLLLQATRLQLGQEPLDVETYSWLNGIFTKSDGKLAAPCGYWDPDGGQVRLGWGEVGNRFDRLGARPEVRG